MSEFENMSLVQLRALLVDTIIELMGRDYAIGWLSSAYIYDTRDMDITRDGVIAQIQDVRSRAV